MASGELAAAAATADVGHAGFLLSACHINSGGGHVGGGDGGCSVVSTLIRDLRSNQGLCSFSAILHSIRVTLGGWRFERASERAARFDCPFFFSTQLPSLRGAASSDAAEDGCLLSLPLLLVPVPIQAPVASEELSDCQPHDRIDHVRSGSCGFSLFLPITVWLVVAVFKR